MKRITISLEEDLYRLVKAHAISSDLSLSKAVVNLLERGIEPAPTGMREDPARYRVQGRNPLTGFPVIEVGRPISPEDVLRAIDDDDLRHLEQLERGSE